MECECLFIPVCRQKIFIEQSLPPPQSHKIGDIVIIIPDGNVYKLEYISSNINTFNNKKNINKNKNHDNKLNLILYRNDQNNNINNINNIYNNFNNQIGLQWVFIGNIGGNSKGNVFVLEDENVPPPDNYKNGDIIILYPNGNIFVLNDNEWEYLGSLNNSYTNNGLEIIETNILPPIDNFNNGDNILLMPDSLLYTLQEDQWVYMGTIKGERGSSLYSLNSQSLPSVEDYEENDSILLFPSGNVYNLKNGSWHLVGSLIGPKGDKGDTGDMGIGMYIINSSVPPSPNNFRDGDSIILMPSSEVYELVNGTWIYRGSANGVGIYVINDSDNPSLSNYKEGDAVVYMPSGNMFKKENNSWVFVGTIKGEQGQQGPQGEQGPPGPPGETGSDGIGIFTIESNNLPPTIDYREGDSIVLMPSGQMYILENEMWVSIGSLKGPEGASIYVILSNNTPPTTNYNEGDSVILMPSGYVYTLENGQWEERGNIIGPIGSPGINGEDGTSIYVLQSDNLPPTLNYNDGDSIILMPSGELYTLENNVWTFEGTLRGPQGNQGNPGNDGIGIYTLQSNTLPPTSDYKEGDSILLMPSGELYTLENNVWVSIGNLMGPPGPQGNTGEDGIGIYSIQSDNLPPTTNYRENDSIVLMPSGEMYILENNMWKYIGTLKGDIGPKGDTGADGVGVYSIESDNLPPTSDYEEGDSVLLMPSGSLYNLQEGQWVFMGSLKGNDGIQYFETGIYDNGSCYTNYITPTRDDISIANINFLIKPKGTGAIQASDLGPCRGIRSVDLQTEVSPSGQYSTHVVTGDYSGCLSGRQNKVDGNFSSVGGGERHIIQDRCEYSFIGQGFGNDIEVNGQHIRRYGTIVNGQSNTIVSSSYSSILNGNSNETSANYTCCLTGSWLVANEPYMTTGGHMNRTENSSRPEASIDGPLNVLVRQGTTNNVVFGSPDNVPGTGPFSAGTLFSLGFGDFAQTERKDVFLVNKVGVTWTRKCFACSFADVAEIYICNDEKYPSNGTLLTVDKKGYVHKYKEGTNESIIGIVSSDPMLLGNSDGNFMKYQRDEKTGLIIRDENGNPKLKENLNNDKYEHYVAVGICGRVVMKRKYEKFIPNNWIVYEIDMKKFVMVQIR